MSESPIWLLDRGLARLQRGPLTATLSLAEASRGLSDVRLGTQPLLEGILGIEAPADHAQAGMVVEDSFCRGGELTVIYAQSSQWPIRLEARWRVELPEGSHRQFLAVVDLIVSVRTELLDSRPGLSVVSRGRATETLRFAGTETLVTTPVGLPSIVRRGDGSGCMLFRLPDGKTSYAEMLSPADFQQTEVTPVEGGRGTWVCRHALFAQPLEKGVVLRARVRGVVMPTVGDAQAAWDGYRAHASAEPPLDC